MKEGSIAKTTLAALILVLVLVGSVTMVAVGTIQIAHATISASEMNIGQQATKTDEGSYLYGYEGGKSEWQSCAFTSGEGDCTFAHDYCSGPIQGISPVYDAKHNGYPAINLGNVSNVSACISGYTHAWNHFCDHVAAKKADVDCPLSQRQIPPVKTSPPA